MRAYKKYITIDGGVVVFFFILKIETLAANYAYHICINVEWMVQVTHDDIFI